MQYLFDSDGHYIANFVNGELYDPSGHNIGHYRPQEQIFVDMSGKYLGEIVHEDRLLYNRISRYRSATYSATSSHGPSATFSNPGNKSSIGTLTNYEDIPRSRLRP